MHFHSISSGTLGCFSVLFLFIFRGEFMGHFVMENNFYLKDTLHVIELFAALY